MQLGFGAATPPIAGKFDAAGGHGANQFENHSMNFFIIRVEDERLTVLKASNGVVHITTAANEQPTLFSVERVPTHPRGFLLRTDDAYLFRCKQGPVVLGAHDDADVFTYSTSDNLLYVVRDDERFVCVVRDGILMADQVIQVRWERCHPQIQLNHFLFTFSVFPHPLDRGSLTLFLSPGQQNETTVLRQGFPGNEVIACKRSDADETLSFLALCSGRLVLTPNRAQAQRFSIRNGTPYLTAGGRTVPLCAGDQSTKGYQLACARDRFTFHPLD